MHSSWQGAFLHLFYKVPIIVSGPTCGKRERGGNVENISSLQTGSDSSGTTATLSQNFELHISDTLKTPDPGKVLQNLLLQRGHLNDQCCNATKNAMCIKQPFSFPYLVSQNMICAVLKRFKWEILAILLLIRTTE